MGQDGRSGVCVGQRVVRPHELDPISRAQIGEAVRQLSLRIERSGQPQGAQRVVDREGDARPASGPLQERGVECSIVGDELCPVDALSKGGEHGGRRGRVAYVNRGHAETQTVEGRTLTLGTDLIDENLKGLDEWFARQNRYSSREAEHEHAGRPAPWRAAALLASDPLARREAIKGLASALPGRPVWYFLYSYVLRGGFLDGLPGFVFCVLRSFYQGMISIKRMEMGGMGKADPQ